MVFSRCFIVVEVCFGEKTILGALLLLTEEFLCVDKMSYLYKKNLVSSGFPACNPCFLNYLWTFRWGLFKLACLLALWSLTASGLFLLFSGVQAMNLYLFIHLLWQHRPVNMGNIMKYMFSCITLSHTYCTLLECVKPIINFSSLMCLLVGDLIHLILYDQIYIK